MARWFPGSLPAPTHTDHSSTECASRVHSPPNPVDVCTATGPGRRGGSVYGREGKLGRSVEVERRSFLVHPAVEVVAERLPGGCGGPVENR
jgi:hypothetical protein